MEVAGFGSHLASSPGEQVNNVRVTLHFRFFGKPGNPRGRILILEGSITYAPPQISCLYA
jgi:hypothetical protein